MSISTATLLPIKRVIVWGHPLYSHTQSYIHQAYFRAFQYLGFETHWLGYNNLELPSDLAGTLFFTEGQVDGNIPLHENCYYIIHNCDGKRYPSQRTLAIQAYTRDVLARSHEQINAYTYTEINGRLLTQPWATDLLPNEIDPDFVPERSCDEITWVGTIGGGEFGNEDQIAPFKRAAESDGIRWAHKTTVSPEEGTRLIRKSLLAPAIAGRWQLEKGYVPCRLFKNVSYGMLGGTNSLEAKNILDGLPIQADDTGELYRMMRAEADARNTVRQMVMLVREKHTYVNRVRQILASLERIV